MAEAWDSDDAWVLKAISCTSPAGHAGLTDVIGAADYLNHAIITEREFTKSVGRLLAAGLIGVDLNRDAYWLTEAGRALCQRRDRGPAYLSGISSGLRALGPPPSSAWSLPRGTFDAATAAYLARD